MVQADICKYIILSDTDRKKGDLQYPHPNVVHRSRKFPSPNGSCCDTLSSLYNLGRLPTCVAALIQRKKCSENCTVLVQRHSFRINTCEKKVGWGALLGLTIQVNQRRLLRSADAF